MRRSKCKPPRRTILAHQSRGDLRIRSIQTNRHCVDSLAKLKNSIELGPLGEVVKRADVVPDSTYETLGKVGQVVSSPQNAERFLSYPGAKELTENPKIIALRDDPEIMRMIQEGRILDLLQDPRILDAMNDPNLVNGLKAFQLQRALDYATKPR